MIYLGLWLLFLGVSAVEAASIQQNTAGPCSPTIGQTGGSVQVTINCPGLDRQAEAALNKELGLTKAQLRLTEQQLAQKTKEANERFRLYEDLLRKYEALQDSQLTSQGKALLNNWKLNEAADLLKRSTISMAHYDAIQSGMSYQQVVNILGRRGEETSRAERIVSYIWKNPDWSMLAINFIDGRVSVKHQAGLR